MFKRLILNQQLHDSNHLDDTPMLDDTPIELAIHALGHILSCPDSNLDAGCQRLAQSSYNALLKEV